MGGKAGKFGKRRTTQAKGKRVTTTITTIAKSKPGVVADSKTVLISSIVADDTFNARKTYDEKELKSLAANIRRNSQLHPVVVKANGDGQYYLVAGFRRYRALKDILEADTIKVEVMESDNRRAMITNLAENMGRDNLEPWEIGERAIEMRNMFSTPESLKKGKHPTFGGADIARELGVSKNYINNLMRTVETLHPTVLKFWKEQEQKESGGVRLKLTDLIKHAKLDHVEQLEWFDKQRGRVQPDKKEPGKREPKSGEPTRASVTHLKRALAAVKASSENDHWKKGAMTALAFALGIEVVIKVGRTVVYDPSVKPEKAAKKSKAA